jgi:transposase
VTQGRLHAPAKHYLARRQAEGKTKREALRALKRHLARRVFRICILTLIANRANNPNRIDISTAPHVPCLT